MRYEASSLHDPGEPCWTQAKMATLLAAKPGWEAANACMQVHGGFGFANAYGVERQFRETRLYQVAPISTNLILSHVAEHVLGLPQSFKYAIVRDPAAGAYGVRGRGADVELSAPDHLHHQRFRRRRANGRLHGL